MKYIFNKKNNVRREKGFTIIETLVAISILAVAITGPLAIISQSLRNSFYARDQVTAFYLAQEAIEYIRNQRDNNALLADPLDSANWLNNVTHVTGNPDSSLINSSGSTVKANLQRTSDGYTLTSCFGGACPPLKYADPENTSGYIPYGHDAPTLEDSIFTREIIFNRVPHDVVDGSLPYKEIVVTVRVKWKTPSGQHTVVLRDNLNNWQLEEF